MRRRLPLMVLLLALFASAVFTTQPTAAETRRQTGIRFATFNASLNRNQAGQLLSDLATGANQQARNVAEVIQRVNPDVLLINEFDYDEAGEAAQLFQRNYLAVSQNGATPVRYRYVYVAPSNTGIPSGFDLDNNGSIGGPNDAFGFGFFPGQYGMAVFSKFPFDSANIRTFQKFLWKDMPGNLLPPGYYSADEQAIVRLSSKSHWDIPINIGGQVVHLLASHPTPPVFDGPEDRNGRRNADEIRLWADYITPGAGDYVYDDQGRRGGLPTGARFVIMGDQNSDPRDGDSRPGAIQQLLDSPLVYTAITPASPGGPEQAAAQGGANTNHKSDPAFDTADFADTTPGNLRVDYVLPSLNLRIRAAAVFWPASDDPLFRLVGTFDPALPGGFPTSDHRLVWADIAPVGVATPSSQTQPVIDDEDAAAGRRVGDADDPAIWVHPTDPAQSLVIAALKEGGLDVYDLAGKTLQQIAPAGVRYNNADVLYGLRLGGKPTDLAVATDRFKDNLAIYAINPASRKLTAVANPSNPLIFTPAGQESDEATTAYGLALYHSPRNGSYYAFVSQREADTVVQLELFATGASVSYREVRRFTLPIPAGGEREDAQIEGMVADQQLGQLYLAQENAGIWKIGAEPDAAAQPKLIAAVYPAGRNLLADAEGLTLYYTKNGRGYLLASSQGDSTFAVFSREGDNRYLGSFRVGRGDGIDDVQFSDGADVINVPLGPRFPHGLLVVHDGANEPPVLVEDDGELENVNTNFKFVGWEEVVAAFEDRLLIDTTGYDPRR